MQKEVEQAVSETIRVLHVTDSLHVGGLEKIVVQLAHGLSARGLSVGVAAEVGGELWDDLPSNVRRYALPRRSGIRALVRYIIWQRQIVLSDRWQIVHVHQRRVALLSRIAVLGSGVKVVEHVHNMFQEPNVLERGLSFRGHQLVACGPAIAKMLVNDFRRKAARVRVVRNAVPDIGRDSPCSVPASTGSTLKILGIGRLVEQKDPFRFVDVVRSLNDLQVPLVAEWVGDGDLRDAACRYAVEQGVNNIAFTGQSLSIEKKMLGADLLLLTSRWEGLPLVVLEALALGRGVVAPDVGSCSDVVVSGRNGLLFPVQWNGHAIAAAMAPALTTSILQAWSDESRLIFSRMQSPEAMVNDIMEAYRLVLMRRRPR